MANEEGLKILLKAEAQDFLKDMKAGKAAIVDLASSVSSAVKSFLGLSSAADEASKSTEDLTDSLKDETNAANQAGQATGGVGKYIRQMTYERKLALIQMRDGIGSWKLEAKAVNDTIPPLQNTQKQMARTGAVMTGLNRVVQDAPFGYIAIQNNLTELFSAYQNLTKQLGSGQAAFKAVASSLIGAGGLGLAFSAVTSLITVAIQKYGSLGAAFEVLTGELTAAEKLQRDYNKAVSDGVGRAQGEISVITGYLAIARDETVSRDQRLKAIKEIQKEFPGYLKNLSLENINSQETTNSINRLTEALIRKAKVQGAQDLIAKEQSKIFEAQNKSLDEQANLWDLIKAAAASAASPISQQAIQISGGARSMAKNVSDATKNIQSLQQIINGLLKQDALDKVIGFDDKEKAVKHIKTVADVLKELQAALNATDAQAKLFGGTADKLAQEKLTALNKAFDDLVKLGLKPTSPELKKIADQINLLSASIIGVKPLTTILAQPLGKAVRTSKVKPLTPEELEKILGIKGDSQLFLEPKVKVDPIFQQTPALQNVNKFSTLFAAKMGQLGAQAKKNFGDNFIVWGEALTSGLAPAIVTLGSTLQQGLSNTFASIGEGIGKAFASGGLSDVLKGIVNSMSDFIITFGKQLIEAGTLALIAQKSIIANPYLAIAAGLGAIAIGTALKNKVPAFATGGTVSGPTLAMVGDNPSGVEHIIPQEVLDRLGGGDGFVAETRLSGSDILVVVKRAGLNQNRVNG